MNLPERLEGPQADAAPSMVTLQFRHDQKNSGVSRHGRLRPNGRLRIEYEPARVVPEGVAGSTVTDVICHLRFQPNGEQRNGSLVQHAPHPGGGSRPLVFEEGIPSGTTRIEAWFEARASTGTVGWDSRYGQNYTFAVADEGLPIPERSVALRAEARVDASRIGVVDDAASKQQVATGAAGNRLRTGLVVRARVGQPSASAVVWADVHVFDAMGDLIHAGSIALEPGEPSMEDTLRLWDAEVYAGSGGASGAGVWSRPDAHTVQYRLYCQEKTQVFTDGVLHQFEVPADTAVRPIPGGW